MKTVTPASEHLCLSCGLCCDGVLFKDVELQCDDDASKLKELGLFLEKPRSKARSSKLKFSQPCAALCADNCCRIYADRPSRCRDFECALFKAVAAGNVTLDTAWHSVHKARQRAGEVRRLLRKLGDTEEHLALSLRFKRIKRRLEFNLPDDETAAVFADLTLAVHALNLLLRETFYPV